MLALDKLSDLSTEHRALRKMTIAKIEPMLDSVDDAKSRICKLQRKLESEHVTQNSSVKESLARNAPAVESSEQTSAPCNAKNPIQAQQFTGPSQSQQSIPTPDADFWRGVPLDFRHQTIEEGDKYLVVARMKNLSPDDITVELSNDMRVLNVSGLCLPTKGEATQLRKTVEAQFLQLMRTSPQARLHAKEIIGHLYAEAGHGCFGSFAERFQVPRDVDVRRIQTSCSGDLIHIVLPKMSRQMRSQPSLRTTPRYMGHLY
jgi:HSP20 family molecular chaperone IbpA